MDTRRRYKCRNFVFIRLDDLNFMWVVLLRESDRVELEARLIFL